MRNQVIKIGALFVLIVFSTCVCSIPDGGKKVIVLPYYKHEVQAIYFKEPSSSAGPPNHEQFSNYLSSKPMGIKVWVEKRPSPANQANTNGYSYNFNSNNGAVFSSIQVHGNRPMNNAWQGSQGQWPGNQGRQPGFSGDQPSWSGNQPGFSGSQPPWSGNQPGFSGSQPPWSGNQPGFSGNQPSWSGNQPPSSGTQPGFSGSQPPWSGNQPPGSGNQHSFSGYEPPKSISGNKPPWSGNQPTFSGNQPPSTGNQPLFSGIEPPRSISGNQPPWSGNQPGFSGSQHPWSENQPSWNGNQPPGSGNQHSFSGYERPRSISGNQPSWSGNQPPSTGNQPPSSGNQPSFSGNEPPRSISGNQPPWSGNQPSSSGNQPGFSENEPPRKGSQPGFSGSPPPWSERQPGAPDNNFQPPRFEGNSYNKYPNGDVTRPTDSFSSSWSSIKVVPADQRKPVQTSTHINTHNSRWPSFSTGKNAHDEHPQQGSNQQPPDSSFLGGRSQWEGQGGRYLPAGDDGWQPLIPHGNNEGWRSPGSQTDRSLNGNVVGWNQETSSRETNIPGGKWETQTQEEWEKNQQGTTGNSFGAPEPVTWSDEQQRWPKTTATSPAKGWSAPNEVNDGLREECPPGVGGNNCFREVNNGVRVRNNHQNNFGSEKPVDGVLGGWEPLLNGEGNAANNYEEVSFKSGKPQEIYLQRENSFSGSSYSAKNTKVKNAANNLNALDFNNYRLRESQGVSSNFAPVDNRSNRNGKYKQSEDAELYVGQDSYGVLINHKNSDFYRHSRNADVVSGGKFPAIDSFSSATFGGVKTRVKTSADDKEKRGKTSDGVVEFGKKLKVGAKKLKKASVDDLSTS